MTATSGRKFYAVLQKPNPAGCCLKMLLGTSAWGSTTCLLTWRAKSTPQRRPLFQLWPSTPDTDGIGSGLWPTPRANSAMAARITEHADEDRYPNLETVVKKRHPQSVGRYLNHRFVQQLMGYPQGWTDLEPSETR